MEIIKELIPSTKHMDPEMRSEFDKLIQDQINATPVYVVPVASDPEALEKRFTELLTPPVDLVVLEDSDVCHQSKLSSIHASAVVDAYHEKVTDDLTNRLRTGSLNADFDGDPTPGYHDLPEGFRKRIEAIIEERRKILNERIVWFTYRVDEFNQPWIDFPVVGYRFGTPPSDAMYVPSVKAAVRRIAKRGNVKAIRVIGPVPQHWFHGPMEQL